MKSAGRIIAAALRLDAHEVMLGRSEHFRPEDDQREAAPEAPAPSVRHLYEEALLVEDE